MLNNAPDQAKLLENLIRLVDRIEDDKLQDYFPSAHERAKKAIADHQSPATETQQPAGQNPLLENLARLVDRVEDFKLQDHFPSTYKRAKAALANHAAQKDNTPKPSPVDETRMEFGAWLLGEIWTERLVNKTACWYRNNKKVSIVDLHKSWKHGR